jgi:hypothetical protein
MNGLATAHDYDTHTHTDTLDDSIIRSFHRNDLLKTIDWTLIEQPIDQLHEFYFNDSTSN